MGKIQGKNLNYGHNETMLLKFYEPVLDCMAVSITMHSLIRSYIYDHIHNIT